MSLGEFEIIERYFTRSIEDPSVLVGIGDDAAVLDVSGPLAVAVDTLVGGVHFPHGSPARSIGHRVLAVNLSDFAAMAAQARWCTLALTLPEPDAAWLEAFAAGLFELADLHGVALVGGDLTRGPLTATLQLLGPVPGACLTRAGGSIGDDVYVTGTLGDSAAGLSLLEARGLEQEAESGALVQRFLYPTPRVAAGRALGALAHAAIDISDGLIADLGHLCAESGCGASVEVERLPLSGALERAMGAERARRYALAGGDDYELCFAAPPGAAEAVAAACAASATPVRRIGRLVAGSGVAVLDAGAPVAWPRGGYEHFAP